MADVKEIFEKMLEVAKAAAPIVGMGMPEAIALGEKVVALVDGAIEAFDDDPPDELIEERDALEARVNAHVTDTVDKLRGEE